MCNLMHIGGLKNIIVSSSWNICNQFAIPFQNVSLLFISGCLTYTAQHNILN